MDSQTGGLFRLFRVSNPLDPSLKLNWDVNCVYGYNIRFIVVKFQADMCPSTFHCYLRFLKPFQEYFTPFGVPLGRLRRRDSTKKLLNSFHGSRHSSEQSTNLQMVRYTYLYPVVSRSSVYMYVLFWNGGLSSSWPPLTVTAVL